MSEQLLRIQSLCECIDSSTSAIYDHLNADSPRYDPTFPKPIRIGRKSVAWLKSEVDAWIALRIAERDACIAEREKAALQLQAKRQNRRSAIA